MKSFKSFVQQIDELQGVAPKAKKEHDFVHSTYMAQIKDPGDLEKVGPEEEGPKTLKTGQGKRPADRLNNKQPFGEQSDMKHPEDEKNDANKLQKFGTKKWLTKDYKNGKVTKEEVEQINEIGDTSAGKQMLGAYVKKAARRIGVHASVAAQYADTAGSDTATPSQRRAASTLALHQKHKRDMRLRGVERATDRITKEEVEQVDEADFTKQQTKMAHTIGKEFEKKGVGDKSKGGPFAVASAMVRDKPEAAAKAYKTIKAKTQKEEHQIALITLYDSLNEENKQMFMLKLEEDFDKLLTFSIELLEEYNG